MQHPIIESDPKPSWLDSLLIGVGSGVLGGLVVAIVLLSRPAPESNIPPNIEELEWKLSDLEARFDGIEMEN